MYCTSKVKKFYQGSGNNSVVTIFSIFGILAQNSNSLNPYIII